MFSIDDSVVTCTGIMCSQGIMIVARQVDWQWELVSGVVISQTPQVLQQQSQFSVIAHFPPEFTICVMRRLCNSGECATA
jgi:hypothetical protein